jgi:hypothetical protein
MKPLIIALALIGTALPAFIGEAHAADCPAFYLSGLFYRAANVCDHSWLKRPGFLIITSSAAQCKMPPKKAKSLLKHGEDDFDTGVINRGQNAVCAYVDTEMTITENNGK